MEMQIVIKDNYWKKNLVIIYGNWCKMLIFNSGNKDFPGNRVEGGECNNEYTKTKCENRSNWRGSSEWKTEN